MNISRVEKNGTVCAVVHSSKKVITDAQSALDLLMTAKYEARTHFSGTLEAGCLFHAYFYGGEHPSSVSPDVISAITSDFFCAANETEQKMNRSGAIICIKLQFICLKRY